MAITLSELFALDPSAKARAAIKVQEVIEAAAVTHPCNTGRETRRRIQVCCEHIRQCMAEFEWSLTRSLGTMKARLVCHLDGVDWKPDEGETSVGR